jgi:hypothetical protein
MTPQAFMRAVKHRARLAFIASKGKIDFATLEAAAARQIVAEERAKPRTTAYASPPTDTITVKNAREVFISKVQAIAARLATPITPRTLLAANKPPRVVPRPLTHRPHTSDPIAAPDSATAPPVQPNPEPVLLFTSTTNTAAVLIPDSEFEPRWRAQSLATENWRHSIEVNERIAARRRTTWVG